MKILVATDAWHPQVNGVVRTLGHIAREAGALGAQLEFLAPGEFWTLPMPTYPEVRLALPRPGDVERRLERARPDAIHIATEGPLGHAVRRVCLRRGVPFTTSLHTRFPDYLAERLPVPERWTCELTWAWLRRFHSASAAVLAATPTLGAELTARGFKNVKLWSRGVDANLFRPRSGVRARPAAADLPHRRPRGGGKKSRGLSQARSAGHQIGGRRRAGARFARPGSFPARCFSAAARARRWRKSIPPPTCSCSRAAPTPSAWCCWRRWRAGCRSPPFRRRRRAT